LDHNNAPICLKRVCCKALKVADSSLELLNGVGLHIHLYESTYGDVMHVLLSLLFSYKLVWR
jgi:hypothetical protein